MTESKGQSFWATLPGLVTAIAGMVTAIAILITTLARPGSTESSWPRPTVVPVAGGTPRRVTTNGLGPSWGG